MFTQKGLLTALLIVVSIALSGVTEATGTEIDAAMAQRIQESAKQGEADGQYALGWMYEQGQGVSQDDKQAVKWYRNAANQGYALAQYELARMYALGKGIPQDEKKSVELIIKAADQGYAQAQYQLGRLYQAPLMDLGPLTEQAPSAFVQVDDKQAVMWYRKAAEQGHIDAQFALSNMYYYGHGIPRSKTQAYAWGRKAAEQGHAQAQRAVSYYLLGENNLVEGYAWLLTASANGDSVSSHVLHEHEKKLNKQELGKAEALAERYFQEYQPKN
ncbi:tetratricopeptide repeat protein [Aeromonas salmonicida]|uniref:tetratricopeptide repeat protein n=1 Tax=Aeromonas salmonicida TaxID=645 RepID=UPI001F3392B4|nr:tetratricopeptide repeat protein [Aeromonas salmonicida]MCE9933556.1 sel1 repeat family protein [Aeromonas salmonicida]